MEKFALDFLIGSLGYLIRKWFGEHLAKWIFDPTFRFLKRIFITPIKHRLIKTEKDIAIWLHYKNKAIHKGQADRMPPYLE